MLIKYQRSNDEAFLFKFHFQRHIGCPTKCGRTHRSKSYSFCLVGEDCVRNTLLCFISNKIQKSPIIYTVGLSLINNS